MKKYKYEVTYLNGKVETFSCNSFFEAAIKATSFAYDKAWDSSISSITCEGSIVLNPKIQIKYS